MAGEGGQASVELLLPPLIQHLYFLELVGAMLHCDIDGALVEGELLGVLTEHG